jgi:hypothetical protein
MLEAKQGNLVLGLSWNLLSTKFESSMRNGTKNFALASNGVPEQVVREIHERLNTKKCA